MLKNRYEKYPALAQCFSTFQDEHGYFYNEEKRCLDFGIVGKKDIVAEINAHSNECDMSFVKEQLLNNAPCNIPDDMFFDCSNAGDLLENFTKMNIAKTNFYSLPIDIRQKYNNNFEEFAMNYNASDFIKSEGIINEK